MMKHPERNTRDGSERLNRRIRPSLFIIHTFDSIVLSMDIGKKNRLKVSKISRTGVFLRDEENNRLPLAGKYSADSLHVDEDVDAFVYKDSDGRMVATLDEPLIQLNSFAYLMVNEIASVGAFMDWGLEKDLFVPFSEQNVEMVEGRRYVIYLYLDNESQRLVGSNKINKFLSNDDIALQPGDEVDLLLFKHTDLGFKVIINSKHEGLIYHSEIYQNAQVGDLMKGYIKTIREDGKIDVTLQKTGFRNMDANTERVLQYLKTHQGFLPLTDDSSPDDIAYLLQMSKKNFKKATGILFKKRMVQLLPDGVQLIGGE
jgi:predicted RNA-binding protein (virulence factor B family)